jgi:hypothetical protein
MELLNKKIRYIFSALILFSTFGFSQSALADYKQCIKNMSGTSLNVRWKDISGATSNQASNSNLTLGMTACKSSANKLGYAVVSCNGCGLAKPMTVAAVGVVGTGLVVLACSATAAASGACVGMTLPLVVGSLVAAAQANIPKSDQSKWVLMPDDKQTMVFSGTAFNLLVN